MSSGDMMDQEVDLLKYGSVRTIACYLQLLLYLLLSVANVFNILGDSYGSIDILNRKITTGAISLDYPICFGLLKLSKLEFKVNVGFIYRSNSGFSVELEVQSLSADLHLPHCHFDPMSFHGASPVKIDLPSSPSRSHFVDGLFDLCGKYLLSIGVLIVLTKVCCNIDDEMSVAINNTTLELNFSNTYSKGASYRLMSADCEIRCLGDTSSVGPPPCAALSLTGLGVHYNSRMIGVDEQQQQQSTNIDVSLDHCSVALSRESLAVVVGCITKWSSTSLQSALRKRSSHSHWRELAAHVSRIDDDLLQYRRNAAAVDPQDLTTTIEEDEDEDHSSRYHIPLEPTRPASKCHFTAAVTIRALHVAVMDSHETKLCQVFRLSDIKLALMGHPAYDHPSVPSDPAIIGREATLSIQSADSCVIRDCDLLQLSGDWGSLSCQQQQAYHKMHPSSEAAWLSVGIQVSRRVVEADRLVHDSCIRNETTIHIMDISVKLLPTMLPLHLSSLTLLLSASSELSRALQPLVCLRALTRWQQTLLADAVSVNNAQSSSVILGSLDVAAVTSVEVEIRLPRSVTGGDLMASRGATGLRLSLLGIQSPPADRNQPNTAALMVDQVLLTEVLHHHHHHHGVASKGPVDEDTSTYSSFEDEGSVLERLRDSHRTILHIGKLSLQMKFISPLNASAVVYRPSPLDVYRSSLRRPLSSPTEDHDPWRQGAMDAVVDELFGGPQNNNNNNNNQSSQSIVIGSCSITADQCQLISIGIIVGAIVNSSSSPSGAAASSGSGPYSYHSIRCIHSSTSSPLEAMIRSITIEDISVELMWRGLAAASSSPSASSSSPQRSRRSYRLLKSNRVELVQRSLGRVHSSAALFLGGDLSVSSVGGDIGAEEHVRLKLAGPISNDFDFRGVKLWSSKRLPCEVHLRSNPSHHRYPSSSVDSAPVGVELVAEYEEYTLPHLCITWDCTHLDDLCSLINCYRTSYSIGICFASEVMGITGSVSIGNAPEVDHHHHHHHPQQQQQQQQQPPSRDSIVTDTHHTTSQPTRITAISLESINIQMKHQLKPVLCLLSKSARISSLSFGPNLRQLNMLVQSIALHELTTSYAVHTCLLGEVDPDYPSRLELHSTSLSDQFPLLEFQVDNMRIFYLHRAIFSVSSFLIDHCIPSTRSHLIGSIDGLTGSYQGGHSSGWSPSPPSAHYPRRGMLRVGGCFSCSELHLPLNSCSTDALVLIINEWKIYRSCPTILDQSSSYCMGPHLDRSVWIGQMKSSRVLMQQLFSEKRGSPLCSPPVDVHWTLPQQAKLLLIPPVAVTAQGASSLFGLSFSVKKSLLCSWCSANAISEDFTITGTYSLVPSSIIADTTSNNTSSSSSSPQSAVRNTISVDISADEIEWILSQGQYSAIIALIQQNFCELQEHVVPQYVLPPPRLVPLTEHVFGRYALDLQLPILSTVPVHIKKGKVVAIENSPDYYDLFCSPLPFEAGQEKYLVTGSFADTTIPKFSYHADHRRSLFAHVISERAKRRVSRSRHFETDPPIEPQYYSAQTQMYPDLDGEGTETTVLSIIFQAMELDFYRRHDNGGNGIEISCQSFVVCSSESDGVVDDDGLSMNSNHDNEMSIGSIMFAPTSYPLLNSALNRGSSKPGGVVDPSSTCAVPHITYSQQGTGNLRRCIINIQDSVAVANMAKVLHGVEYFLKPIHLNGFRNVHIVETRGLLDYLVYLDCEVHVKNTIVCFSSTSHRGEENALCVQVDLDYMQAWRGFLVSGPGKISLNIDVSVTNVYIAPMREINPSNVKSLVNPFVVVVAEKKLVVPEASQLLCNLERLSRFMSLGDWTHRENRLSSPVTYLSLNMRVTPSRLAIESPEASPAMDSVLGGDSGVVDGDGDGYGDGEDVDRDSLDEYDYSNTGYVDVKEASAMRIIVSLKDLLFMAEAANQIRAGLQNRLFIVANRRDLSHMIKTMRQDVQHLPPLSHYLVHTPFPSLIINTDTNNELISEICDFEVLLRNNTYNLDILKMNSYSNSMMYIRSADQLQLESGSSCALWAYNESVEEWEPLVEPTNLRAVAAENKMAVLLGPSSYEDSSSSSSSSGASSSADSMSAKFRIDVMSDPIDVNVSQNALANLVSKLSLPDVVTTSSMLLPPYKVINELGCELRFAIRMGGSCIHSNTLPTGKSIPIEVYQLSEALDSFKLKRKFANTRGDATEDSDLFAEGKQYRIEISFLNRDGILFRSKSTVPMDKVGMHRFEMVATSGPGDRRKSFIGSKPHSPSIDCDEAAALSLSTAGKKAVSFASADIPLVLLDMQIKDDGIRELLLRSIVSLRNNTSQIFQLSVRLDGASTELSLAPSKEWFLPISFAHPKAALFCRIDEQTNEWLEMLPSLQAVITHGYWGVPSKLQAFLCSFDRSTSELLLQETTKALSPTIVLVKPECKFGRSHLRSAESGGSFVSVKYPSTDASSVSSVVSNVESSVLSNVSRIRNIGGKYQPLCIHLLAPLQLCNLITQPLLYRIADAQGVISSEGILLSGELVDVYNLINLFTSKIFISVRMLNYSWSKWVVCFQRGNPYPTGERSVDLSLQSMTFSYDEELLVLPTLDLLMVAKEYLVRFVCPIIISNRTGMQLDLSGPNPSNESFIPYPSKTSVESLLPTMSAAATSTTLRPTIVAEKEIDSPVGKSKACVHRRTYRTAQLSTRVSLNDESDSDRSSQDIVALDRNSFSDSDSDYRSGASSIDSSAVDKLSKGHTCDDSHVHLNIPNNFGLDDDDNCDDDEEEKKKMTAVCEGEEVRGDLMDESKAAMLGMSSSRRGGGGGGVISSGMRSVVPITTSGHSTSSMRVGPIVVLTIHLPFDHLRSIEVIASSEWTLSDVFTRVKQYLAVLPNNQLEINYVFQYFEYSRIEVDSIENSLLAMDFSSSDLRAPLDETDTTTLQQDQLTTSNRNHHPAMASSSPSKEKRQSISLKSAVTKKNEIPIGMRYNMLLGCSLIPLMSSTKVMELRNHRLRICHQTEWEIFVQSSSIRIEEVVTDGLFSSLFSRSKVTYIAIFMKYTGDIPLRSRTMLGHNSSFSIRVPGVSQWSDAIDILKVDTSGSSESCIVLSEATEHSGRLEFYYEFGAHVEKSAGFLHGITSVTIVPKHILVSKLSIPIEVAQLSSSEDALLLTPGLVTSFHYPRRNLTKLLQIRRVLSPVAEGCSDADANVFIGEIDISRIGVVYAKLRNPALILKVQVESVGASLVATFWEQTSLWPPYRIDNLTESTIRFRQVVAKAVGTTSSMRESDNALSSSSIADDSIRDKGAFRIIPWDNAHPRSRVPFAWDLPMSCRKSVQVEVEQVGKWIPFCEVPFDADPDDFHPLPMVINKRAPSSQGNPFAEGFLSLCERDSRTNQDSWSSVYCILRPGVLYVYPDDSRTFLKDVIRMDTPGEGEAPQFATVKKLLHKRSKLTGFFSSSATATPGSTSYDSNQVRVLILKIADKLDLYQDISRDKMCVSNRKRADSDQEGEEKGKQPPAVRTDAAADDAQINVTQKASRSGVRFLFGGVEEGISKALPTAADDGDVDGLLRSTESKKRNTLRTFLSEGVSAEDLLNEISSVPVHLDDVVEAILVIMQFDLRRAVGLERAQEVCDWLLSQGFLAPRSETIVSRVQPVIEEEEEEEDEGGLDYASGIDADFSEYDVGHPPLEPAQTGGSLNRKAFTSDMTGRLTMHARPPPSRNRDLRGLYEGVDLYFCPPSLSPELLAALSETSGGAASEGTDSDIQAGFTIELNKKKHSFKCSSKVEFLGWIQACRQCIERSWVDYFLGRRTDKSGESLEDYQHTVLLKLRADGSTRVLEIIQSDLVLQKSSVNKRKSIKGIQANATAKALNRLRTINSSTVSELGNDEDFIFDREKQLVSALFNVQSIALSVINAEPSELLYLSFHDIEMRADRSIDLVKFSVTVDEIQTSDQLLSPGFPVTLYARKMHQGTKRLLLPGLNPDRCGYPSLHFYIQQRYHQSMAVEADKLDPADATGMVPDSNEDVSSYHNDAQKHEEATNLFYFEIFTLWIAPLQLNLDEEILVKSLRFMQGLRDYTTDRRMNLSLHSSSSPDQTQTSSMFSSSRASRPTSLGISDGSSASSTSILSTKYWESQQRDRQAVATYFSRFVSSGKIPYLVYNSLQKGDAQLYFSLLQLHPLDVSLSFKPSPDLVVSTAELALISILAQLDSAHLRLNAIIAEHLYGSPAFLADFFVKRYRANFWKQFYNFIGALDSKDESESSVLVANLGSGVYDLNYEPIEGLTEEGGLNSTALGSIISKGGKSLAARSIGGTSAIASHITGGIGKGVSILTLDSEFQRHRSLRRYNKATSVSEGLYVGTQELGKNIVEGFTGIVVSPYRGYETGGMSGFGMGIAKGLLGVALKPAVGVLDLASRATEGLKNSALNIDSELRDGVVHRKRIPRPFGRNRQLTVYDERSAAAQYVADTLTMFKQEPRLHVVHHLHVLRCIITEKPFNRDGLKDDDKDSVNPQGVDVHQSSVTAHPSTESWGYPINSSYLILVTPKQIALIELMNVMTPLDRDKSKRTVSISTSSSSRRKVNNKSCKFIWTCPAEFIDQLFSDSRGDLIISLNSSVLTSGPWNSTSPVILDRTAQNYLIFQSLLEQTLGLQLARLQPLQPLYGLTQHSVRKRYSSGLKSYLMLSPTLHTYRLFGHVLYEYTLSIKSQGSTSKTQPPSNTHHHPNAAVSSDSYPDQTTKTMPIAAADSKAMPHEEYIENRINKIFSSAPVSAASTDAVDDNAVDHSASTASKGGTDGPMGADMFLSFVYPLVDLLVSGPVSEDGGKVFSITVQRRDGQKMRVLRCEDCNDQLTEYFKVNLTLMFTTLEDAMSWKQNLQRQTIAMRPDVISLAPLTFEEKRKSSRSILGRPTSSSQNGPCLSADNSILSFLVLPTASNNPELAENVKIEIAKTLSALQH